MPHDRRDRARDALRRLAQGDATACDDAFDALWPLAGALARRFVPAKDADDVAQRALMSVFARALELDPKRDPLAWALTIVAWEARTQRQRMRRRREVDVEALARTAAEAPLPDESAEAAERHARLEDALASLSPSDRETLLAFARDERAPGATFRKRLERALRRLRSAWRSP